MKTSHPRILEVLAVISTFVLASPIGYAQSNDPARFLAGSGERYLGEIIPKPDLIVKVVANMW
ncbi:MAG: hypothetical protein IIB03_07610, partial [Acidobacteria bacterium]|nr:hypothetical protein [Acidobacteriota bacterium]